MQIDKKKVADLNFAPYNPRDISEEELEKLKTSIKKFGYIQPIIWNKKTGYVVGGNQRLKALQELEIKEIDVIIVDLNEEEEKVLNIALNKISGNWNYEKLEEIFNSLDEELLDFTGFSESEMQDILNNVDLNDLYDFQSEDKEKPKEEKILICPHCGTKFLENGDIIE